jgi:hypothetical protein
MPYLQRLIAQSAGSRNRRYDRKPGSIDTRIDSSDPLRKWCEHLSSDRAVSSSLEPLQPPSRPLTGTSRRRSWLARLAAERRSNALLRSELRVGERVLQRCGHARPERVRCPPLGERLYMVGYLKGCLRYGQVYRSPISSDGLRTELSDARNVRGNRLTTSATRTMIRGIGCRALWASRRGLYSY